MTMMASYANHEFLRAQNFKLNWRYCYYLECGKNADRSGEQFKKLLICVK